MIDKLDYEAFRETIRINPLDDAPRLIFADWLEEKGCSSRLPKIMRECVSQGVYRGTLADWLTFGDDLLPIVKVVTEKAPIVPPNRHFPFSRGRVIVFSFQFNDGLHAHELPAYMNRYFDEYLEGGRFTWEKINHGNLYTYFIGVTHDSLSANYFVNGALICHAEDQAKAFAGLLPI